MPTYEYACTSCGHRFEAHQSFSDEPLTACPECGGPLRKVFGSVGIVLKGPGFYRTDSRNGSSTSRPTKEVASKDGSEKAGSSAGTSESGTGSSGTSPSGTGSSSTSSGSSTTSSGSSTTGSSGSATKTAAG